MTRESDTRSTEGRRGLLNNAAATISPSEIPGSPATSVLEDRYGTVIDVADAGADTSGNASITPVLRQHAGDDTLLRFPEGRYYMDSQLRLTNFQNFGLVGDGDATLVPANYGDFSGPQYRLFRLGTPWDPGRDLRVEGFHVDQTESDTGIRVLDVGVSTGLTVRDVIVEGLHDSGTWGPGLFNITDPDGVGVVRRFQAPDGGIHANQTPHAGQVSRGPTGIHTNGYHEGALRLENCVLGSYPGNGLYVNCPGDVFVEDGEYANSAGTTVRMGVGEGRVRNADIEVTGTASYERRQIPLRLDYGSLTVENVDVRMTRANGNGIRVMDEVDEATFRNVTVSNDGPNPNTAIRVNSGAGSTSFYGVSVDMGVNGNALKIPQGGAPVDVDGFAVTGDVAGSPIQETILCQRDGCRFANLDIDQPGSGRRGLLLTGDDIVVTDSEIETDYDAISTEGNGIEIRNTYASATSGSSIQVRSGSVDLSGNSTPSGIDR
ncbi:right-handed parallel beta-helix repeat-containing protein [Saliphagus sp. LR7]|uniref:right-handed parallel beta-helix repeat-containing protein n=1 Tax=Saliphagus sp. LR7 TaxID=2282654 RepID=UPI001E58E678|nr:right-handed parallel beta-helix repeat-containing protein [Saliphagus sp. LR7]